MPQPPPAFTTRRAFTMWLRDTLGRLGLKRTLASLAVSAYELLRDYTPGRRRLRFGDLDYDWEHRVDTTWANVRFGTRLREIFVGRQYQPTDPELFRAVVSGLQIPYEQFTFVDMGSGKGRALLLASEFPFHRIVGVELLPELHTIAQENVRRYQDGAEQQRIELWLGDAREFELPPEPLLVFLFDPFPEHVLEKVIAHLEQSLREHPRALVVMYQNPISEHVLSNAGWLRRLRGNVQYAVYESRASVLGSAGGKINFGR